jgi:acetyl esterase/lipase
LRWVEEHAAELGVAANKIAVGGTSAGGHVALWTAIAATPPGSNPKEAPLAKPAALILFSAVSDTSLETGYTPSRFGDNTTTLSPLHQLDATMPPVLAFHGDSDRTVPFRQASALRDKLVAGGNRCDLVIVPGGDHEFIRDLPGWNERAQEILKAFLAKQGLLAGQPGDARLRDTLPPLLPRRRGQGVVERGQIRMPESFPLEADGAGKFRL